MGSHHAAIAALPPRPPLPAPTTVRVAAGFLAMLLRSPILPLSLPFLRSLFTHPRPRRSRTEPYGALGLGYRSKAQPTSDYAPTVVILVGLMFEISPIK